MNRSQTYSMMIDTGSDKIMVDNFTELEPHSIDFEQNKVTNITKEHMFSQGTAT